MPCNPRANIFSLIYGVNMRTEISIPAVVDVPTTGSVVDHVVENAEKHPNRVALSVPRGDAWVGVTSQEFLDQVRAVA